MSDLQKTENVGIFFSFFLRFYLFEREHKRGGGAEGEGQADSPLMWGSIPGP